MLARLESSQNGKSFPSDWIEGLNRALNENYKNKCDKEKKYFDVYGLIYNKELLLIVSYLSEVHEMSPPVSLFLSHQRTQEDSQHENQEKKLKKVHDILIDLVGQFFDEIFQDSSDEEIFSPHWQTVPHQKNLEIFYKVSRENVAATLEANKILASLPKI